MRTLQHAGRGAAEALDRKYRAVRHSLSLLGPLDIREDHRCLDCHTLTDQEAEASAFGADDLACLGPIDFRVLRASLRRAESDGEASTELRRFVFGQLKLIAQVHGQTLPPDVLDFVERYAA